MLNLNAETLRRAKAGEPVEEGVYRYELELAVKDGIVHRISSEALRQKPNGQGKWQRLFERTGEGRVKDSKAFTLSGYQHLVKTLAPNHTVLSSFAKFSHPTAALIVAAARKAVFQIEPVHSFVDNQVIDYLKGQPYVMSRLTDELRFHGE